MFLPQLSSIQIKIFKVKSQTNIFGGWGCKNYIPFHSSCNFSLHYETLSFCLSTYLLIYLLSIFFLNLFLNTMRLKHWPTYFLCILKNELYFILFFWGISFQNFLFIFNFSFSLWFLFWFKLMSFFLFLYYFWLLYSREVRERTLGWL